MSFIGIVTRKDENTGVTLRAKIVTPSKRKSITKDFKIKIKANGMDDYQCCILACSNAKARMEKDKDKNNVINGDISMSIYGEYGTSISYKLSDSISKYLNENGELVARPKYGDGDVTGSIDITATKNEASVTLTVDIVIRALDAADILNNESIFNKDFIWNLIKGENTSPDALKESLALKPQLSVAAVSEEQRKFAAVNDSYSKYTDIASIISEPVYFKWTLTSSLADTRLGEEETADPVFGDDGIVRCPTYTQACRIADSALNEENAGTLCSFVYKQGSVEDIHSDYVAISGYSLSVTVSLSEDEAAPTKTFFFNCAVHSKYLTNAEVANTIFDNKDYICMTGFYTDNTSAVTTYQFNDTTSTDTIQKIAIAEGQSYVLETCYNGVAENLKSGKLHISEGAIKLNNISISAQIWKFDGTGEKDMYNDFLDNVGNFVIDETDNQRTQRLTIPYDKISMLGSTAEDKQFKCRLCIEAKGYSKDGKSNGTLGLGSAASKYIQFVIEVGEKTPEEEGTEVTV